VQFSYEFNNPLEGLPPREFFANRIRLVVDPAGSVIESSETNNSTHSAAALTTADITVSRIVPHYFRPNNQSPPTAVSFEARVGNGGNAPAPSGVLVKWYNGDPDSGAPLIGSHQTEPLAPGQYERVQLPFNFPFVFTESIWVVADRDGDGGVISEADEDNNEHNWSCLGDITFDNMIDLDDLALLLSNFGRMNAFYTEGDLDFDTIVDLSDLANILGVFGRRCPGHCP
jgi:hypothetical protein